jgi:hypothetical protein
MKETYKKSYNKKRVRDFLIELFYFDQVVGLAGPDINEYVEDMKKRGAKKLILYEYDKATLFKQLLKIADNSLITLIHDDILSANPDCPNTLYDLDFCGSVVSMKEHIKKFKDNFIMTFSTRIGIKETIKTFFKAREEIIHSTIQISTPIEYTIFRTNRGTYFFIKYFDTSAMCCFAKFKLKVSLTNNN